MGTGNRTNKTKKGASSAEQGALPGPTLTLHCGISATVAVSDTGPSVAQAGQLRRHGGVLLLVDEAGDVIAELEDHPIVHDVIECLVAGFSYQGVLHPDRAEVDIDPVV